VNWDDMAVVGRIARAHGNRGQVIVNPETDFPEQRFRPGAEIFVQRDGAAAPLTIAAVRFQHERPVLAIAGVESMDAAEALAGLELRVPVDTLAALPDGFFYRHDLVGCRVEVGSGNRIGTVREVEGTIGTSRLVVDGANGEILIPLAVDICRTIDVSGRRIVIEPPEGLLELNESRAGSRKS